jgi:hypothetical protein
MASRKAVNDKVDKLELEQFAAGTDRVFHHKGLGIYFRARIEVTPAGNECPTCRHKQGAVGAPLVAPISCSVVECNEQGEVVMVDGLPRVLGMFRHAVAVGGLQGPAHWSAIKTRMRDFCIQAVEANAAEEQLLAENMVPGLTVDKLRKKQAETQGLVHVLAELERLRTAHNSLGEALSTRTTQLAQVGQELERATVELHRTRAEVVQANDNLAAAREDAARASATAAALQAKVEELTARLEAQAAAAAKGGD